MTTAIRLIAVFPVLLAAVFLLAADLGFQAIQIPGAPPDAYWLTYLSVVLAVVLAAVSWWLITTPKSETPA